MRKDNHRSASICYGKSVSRTDELALWQPRIEIAKSLARTTGMELLKLFDNGADAMTADRIADRILTNGLRTAFPAERIVSEEGEAPEQMSHEHHWWLLDPVDGSKYFTLRRRGWSIMMALMYAGRPVFGLVHEPLSQRLWTGIVGLGAWEEGRSQPLRVTQTDRADELRIVIKPKDRNSDWPSRLRSTLKPRSILQLGSVGLRACTVACGEADLQVHPQAGLKTWDTAAGEAIVLAAGGFCTDMKGTPLQYNRPLEPHRSGLLIGNARGYVRVLT